MLARPSMPSPGALRLFSNSLQAGHWKSTMLLLLLALAGSKRVVAQPYPNSDPTYVAMTWSVAASQQVTMNCPNAVAAMNSVLSTYAPPFSITPSMVQCYLTKYQLILSWTMDDPKLVSKDLLVPMLLQRSPRVFTASQAPCDSTVYLSNMFQLWTQTCTTESDLCCGDAQGSTEDPSGNLRSPPPPGIPPFFSSLQEDPLEQSPPIQLRRKKASPPSTPAVAPRKGGKKKGGKKSNPPPMPPSLPSPSSSPMPPRPMPPLVSPTPPSPQPPTSSPSRSPRPSPPGIPPLDLYLYRSMEVRTPPEFMDMHITESFVNMYLCPALYSALTLGFSVNGLLGNRDYIMQDACIMDGYNKTSDWEGTYMYGFWLSQTAWVRWANYMVIPDSLGHIVGVSDMLCDSVFTVYDAEGIRQLTYNKNLAPYLDATSRFKTCVNEINTSDRMYGYLDTP